MSAARQIARNIRVHDRIARSYDATHGEIFNDIEQTRLRASLERARVGVATGSQPLKALDFGCGSGNLSRHLLALGMDVVAADVSRAFLDVVEQRFPADPLSTLLLTGDGLPDTPDGQFDFAAAYSVLHHIPHYLAAVREMERVVRPGGVLLLDHEPTEAFWAQPAIFREFEAAALKPDWRKFLKPSNYVHKVRRLFDPRHTNEGDIHVWPDDHVEWPKIVALLEDEGFEILFSEDYLLFRERHRIEVYRQYENKCADMRVMAFRKRG